MALESKIITECLRSDPQALASLSLDRLDGTISNHPWVQNLIKTGLFDPQVMLDAPDDEKSSFFVQYRSEIRLFRISFLTTENENWLSYPLFETGEFELQKILAEFAQEETTCTLMW